MAFWQQDTIAALEPEILDARSAKTSELVFLLDMNGRVGSTISLSHNQRVLLDGPYDNDIGLETYEAVVLVAEGGGIATVLPYMTTLAARRCHDKRLNKSSRSRIGLFRDRTRRVDLFWFVEDDGQIEWARGQLEHLQALDPDNVSSGPEIKPISLPITKFVYRNS
ncbi:hypothetical protein BD289DRAFT_500131 [Coniella lustricola]|uniref:Ferric reductase NAD binding domain-containing protein n=1 Tax=Coniella lustricola TaxID=2025994 RepID=A0A2T3A7P0_9PEZI|nr:hypothetical protein BD289DRAFT_500131 [Coniella lustricola]